MFIREGREEKSNHVKTVGGRFLLQSISSTLSKCFRSF